ncbi:hypothetical protein [Streptomyces sp. NRRL S-31]|uniref:hypothetical protein n=1 Tax=Streptomyces sp. NRRL S-31 TaxID=1463898 RepID=UPI0004C5E6CD|nr:hypothetical protein [Streptomyces sp. NRRL S-31]
MSAPGTPRREVVTAAPRTPRAGRAPTRPVRTHDELPAVEALTLRSLMRRQLQLGLTAFGVLLALLGPLPLAFTALPDPATRPGGAVIVWAVLGVAVYPLLVLVGRWYVVRAERAERDAADLLGRS